MFQWLKATDMFKSMDLDTKKFIDKYHDLQKDFLNYLKEGALTKEEVKDAIQEESTDLAWDYIMIDESQDWPEIEKKYCINSMKQISLL